MATLNDKYVVVGQPDGFTDENVVRSRVFKKTFTNFGTVNEGDVLAASTNYAVAKFPAGFIPRTVIANVIEANDSAASVTVNVAKTVTDLTNATVAAVKSGENASVVALGEAGVKAPIDVTVPWVTGENDYLVLTTGAAAVDAKFEVVVLGDWPELTGVEHLPKLS